MKSPRPQWTIGFGPVVKYSNTPLSSNEGNFIASRDNPWYGTGSFGQAGAQGEVFYDARDNSGYPARPWTPGPTPCRFRSGISRKG